MFRKVSVGLKDQPRKHSSLRVRLLVDGKNGLLTNTSRARTRISEKQGIIGRPRRYIIQQI